MAEALGLVSFKRELSKVSFKYGRVGQMQVKPNDFLCCAIGDFMGPGTFNVARLDGMKG